jgi:hypothetical protein
MTGFLVAVLQQIPEGFAPVTGGPQVEQIPAGPLVVRRMRSLLLMVFYLWTIWRRIGKVETEMRTRTSPGREAVTAGHFIFIPSVLLVGVVIGWILGSRAARDAFAAELRRREERAAQKAGKAGGAG